MGIIHRAACALPFVAAACLLEACNGGGAGMSPGLPAANQPKSHAAMLTRVAPLTAQSRKIKHIIIIVQENRSFNNLFYGYKGAKTAQYGYDSYGEKIKLLPVPLETPWDIEHDSYGDIAACDGTGSIPGTNCKMDGFNKEQAYCYPCPIPHPEYAYVPHGETKPYFDMAHEWVLADQMYASNFDASSFISHQYIISGQAESAVNFPFTSWGCPGGPADQIYTLGQQRQILYSKPETVCWDPTTLGDELDKASVSWAFYGEFVYGSPWLWVAYQAINHIYNGPDWSKDIISKPSQVLTDVANGTLRSVSWVTPTWTNSDHAGSGSKTGPSWVTSVVNAIGESKYWDSSAIFVFWDDYGGWYDPEPQPYADYDGLGMRLPMLIISPYARHGRVSHVQYEHGSILKFVEDTFGLGRLTASDTRANSPAGDSFDFRQSPRPFVPIQSPYDKSFFLHQPPDHHVVDAE